MSVPRSYAEAPQEIRDAVEHLIRTYGSDPALLAGAIVSATSMSIMAAKAEEREACAKLADDSRNNDAGDYSAGADDSAVYIAAAIRKRGGE